jgi:hypothetical protein
MGVIVLQSRLNVVKGEMIMNRFRLLIIITLVMAVTAFSTGIGISYAEQPSNSAKPTDEEAAAATKRKEDSAVKALTKRAEMLKQRKAAKEYIKKVVEGQQPLPDAAAPNNAGKEGAK